MTDKPTIVIAAGGTGGHIYPALAVADWLRGNGADVAWIGARGGMEADVVPGTGIGIDYVDIAGLRGKGIGGWLSAPWRIGRAVAQALRILARRGPDAVLGMGGFVTGPAGLAARLRGTPLMLHEQNAIAGLTNRVLARVADGVLEAFPHTFDPRARAVTVGNPVRRDIVELPPPERRFEGRGGPLRVFVFGGSQGALALNETVPQGLGRLAAGERPVVRHQSGRRNLEQTRAAYERAGVEVELLPFVEDMAGAYGWADLVIGRAGALTVSELAAAGVASVLVPFPHAVDDHQTRNADFLAQEGAAVRIQQPEFTPERLAELLRALAADGRDRVLEMAKAARRLAQPDAAAMVGQACLDRIRDKGEAR